MRKRPALIVLALSLVAFGATSVGGALPQALGAATPHLVVIVMENKESASVVASPAAPYINNTLIPASKVFTQYFAAMHPSLPNYLTLTSARYNGCIDDACPRNSDPDENLFHQLNTAGVSWKAYADGMKTPCALGSKGTYLVRHNPPPYYTNLAGTGPGTCAAQDVPYTQLASDIANDPTLHTLPQFIWITPDKFNDMHNDHKLAPCLLGAPTLDEVCQGDTWLAANVPPLLALNADADLTNDVTVVLIFDEGSTGQGGGGKVLALATGPNVIPGVDATPTGHVGLLNAIEAWFGLPALAPSAVPIG